MASSNEETIKKLLNTLFDILRCSPKSHYVYTYVISRLNVHGSIKNSLSISALAKIRVIIENEPPVNIEISGTKCQVQLAYTANETMITMHSLTADIAVEEYESALNYIVGIHHNILYGQNDLDSLNKSLAAVGAHPWAQLFILLELLYNTELSIRLETIAH